jgi:hypothetical protein
MDKQSSLRGAALAVAAASALFWVYGIYYLIANANPRGGGMELVAIVPMTVIFAALTIPAVNLARRNRRLGLALGLAAVSLIANLLLWRQILIDLAPG